MTIRTEEFNLSAKSLARDCHHLSKGFPSLTEFTQGVSSPGAQIVKVHCVCRFRHRPGMLRVLFYLNLKGFPNRDGQPTAQLNDHVTCFPFVVECICHR